MTPKTYDVIGFRYLKEHKQLQAEPVAIRVVLGTARRFVRKNKTRYPYGVDIFVHPVGLSLIHK